MGETFSKKEQQKKKAKEKQEKAEKMRERRANAAKGKSLEDMMAYLDEDGNLTTVPPDGTRRKEINLEDIQLGAAPKSREEEVTARTGTVTFYNDAKGFGFITDSISRESVFVHVNNASEPLRERDKVQFEIERTPRGLSAVKVKKI